LPRDVGVVVVAAGQGTRMGGEQKQFRELAGVPVLLRALRPFTSHPDVATTVVAIPALRLVAGGRERGDSVRAGVAALPAACRIVLVHDAARPLVSAGTITAVIQAARAGAGAIAAIPVGDTLKVAADGPPPHTVERTLPRAGLWRAQTPQGFPRDLLERALAAAAADGVQGTDDAELVERIGGRVELVPDSPRNLKLTAPADFEIAELLLRAGS